jgi:hypothetical protein
LLSGTVNKEGHPFLAFLLLVAALLVVQRAADAAAIMLLVDGLFGRMTRIRTNIFSLPVMVVRHGEPQQMMMEDSWRMTWWGEWT